MSPIFVFGIWIALCAAVAETHGVSQVQLPIFPTGTTQITNELAFERRDNQVVYFNGHLPVFTHEVVDLATFRLFTTQLIINGTASQSEISRAFGIPLVTIKRCCKTWRERGPAGFFVPPAKRHGHRLTVDRLADAQVLLSQGASVPMIASQLGVLATTIHKAIKIGRLTKKKHPIRRSLRRQQKPPQATSQQVPKAKGA